MLEFIEKVLLFILIVRSTIFQSNCSFIDVNQPIVIRDTNAGDSFFSYSITAKSSPTIGDRSLPSTIYIGAPKGNDSRGQESGSIWTCSLELRDSDTVYCNVLQDFRAEPKRSYSECCYPYNNRQQQCYSEITEKMWFGNSITSINNKNEFVSCGYRWATEEEGSYSRRLNGICYHVSISDNIKTGRTGVSAVKRLKPPLHRDSQFISIGEVNDHLWFYGEFGFSSVFEPKRNLFLVGAPGHFHWRGTVILYEGFNNSPDVTCAQTNTINSLVSRGEPLDYLGYTVTTGNYYLPNEFVFAAGAPRGRSTTSKKFLSGYVAILTAINPYVNTRAQIAYSEWIFGNQFGSYFGSVLTSADVNGDGLDELIIGAPLFSARYSSDSFDEGCVFIYTNKGTTRRGLRFNERLCSNRDSGGRFGSAITNMGDINHDGFEDIAISAPMSRNGVGEVYIFYGSSNKLSDNPENPIVIYGGDVNTDLKGFGLSLFGNVDMDGNRTPDLLIGSYTSKHLALYRTRPRLDINLELNGYVTNNQPIEKVKREDKDFKIKACIRIQRKPDLDGPLNVWAQITADSEKTGTARFHFVESNDRTLLLSTKVAKGQCTSREIAVKLVADLQPTDFKEISFHWKVWYNDTLNLTKDVRYFDIAGLQAGKVVPARRQFCSYCPAPTEMEYKHSIPLANDNCDSDANPKCSSDLTINARFIGESNKLNKESLRNEYVIGSEELRLLEISVTNAKETAYAPTVELSTKFFSAEMAKNVQIFLYEQQQECSFFSNTLGELEEMNRYRCEVPLHHGKTMILRFRLTFGKLRAMPVQEKIDFEVSVYPQLHPEQLKKSSLELTLKSDFELIFKESKNEPRSEISFSDLKKVQSFVNSYTIMNSGLSPLESVKVVFYIPVNRTIDGKTERVLRVAEPRPKELSCSTTDPTGFAIFDNTVTSISESNNMVTSNSSRPVISRRRRRRQTDNISNEDMSKKNQIKLNGKSVIIGCEAPSNWKCVMVTCIVTVPLQTKKPINIDLRLAIVSKIAKQIIPEDARQISVTTSGEASVFEDQRLTQKAMSSTHLEVLTDEGFPVWLIFVSAVAGHILFLLVTFGLFKCGFFRRKTKEDLQALKERAKEEDLLAQNFPNVDQNNDDDEE